MGTRERLRDRRCDEENLPGDNVCGKPSGTERETSGSRGDRVAPRVVDVASCSVHGIYDTW